MGEITRSAPQLSFNLSVNVDFQGSASLAAAWSWCVNATIDSGLED